MRKFFVHIHIPKCGGSTVRDFLSRNFGPALGNTKGILNDYQYDAEQISRIIDHFPALTCLTGHKLSLDLPFDRTDLRIHAFTWIRDPVDRFVSHYFFHRNHTTLVPEAKTMDLAAYTQWALRDGNQQMYINGQTRFLSGGNLDVIKQAVEANRLLLFPLSHLEESFFTLSGKFPEFFPDPYSKTKNVSKKDQSMPANYREQILPFVADDLSLLAMAEETPLISSTAAPRLQKNALKFAAQKTARAFGRVLVRWGNYLSRIG